LKSIGRKPTFSACSETRAARLAERVAEKVATASTSVPPAVANEAIVPASKLAIMLAGAIWNAAYRRAWWERRDWIVRGASP
jgi:hypothetical protein